MDEELPDYITVMVANKKSQDQMTEDLSLFVGNNTIRFTVWLHGVLDKLRSVTTGKIYKTEGILEFLLDIACDSLLFKVIFTPL